MSYTERERGKAIEKRFEYLYAAHVDAFCSITLSLYNVHRYVGHFSSVIGRNQARTLEPNIK